ncbi:Glyoxalase/bleomycin resistance protein/dioxygenase [Chloroherpeton thalassium ATCC 35110]|uniref:Glyoxalase/bleomycin resistance protein/dioxygenase n=1 Tax=Chloroherpeton thalassium (strain ATCC 35110 / GB-78) TaxID=517418 RepID=B3QTN8_CHLT3|nr:VOC family protein [Chloroherpeton thalassium]ACF14236.1 Glyoxalase/bleomycin resistance protein/dioxygenase [Chloroherpeton thalassium ATCC 35110]
MNIQSVSAAFTTEKVQETKAFYIKHLGAKLTFDCGWYINLEFGEKSRSLQFMSPKAEPQKPSVSDGLMYSFAVPNVDEVYENMTGAGLIPTMPLEDHPWGDRGFAVQDPNGIMLYFYTEAEPSDEFKAFFIE